MAPSACALCAESLNIMARIHPRQWRFCLLFCCLALVFPVQDAADASSTSVELALLPAASFFCSLCGRGVTGRWGIATKTFVAEGVQELPVMWPVSVHETYIIMPGFMKQLQRRMIVSCHHEHPDIRKA